MTIIVFWKEMIFFFLLLEECHVAIICMKYIFCNHLQYSIHWSYFSSHATRDHQGAYLYLVRGLLYCDRSKEIIWMKTADVTGTNLQFGGVGACVYGGGGGRGGGVGVAQESKSDETTVGSCDAAMTATVRWLFFCACWLVSAHGRTLQVSAPVIRGINGTRTEPAAEFLQCNKVRRSKMHPNHLHIRLHL